MSSPDVYASGRRLLVHSQMLDFCLGLVLTVLFAISQAPTKTTLRNFRWDVQFTHVAGKQLALSMGRPPPQHRYASSHRN